MARVTVIMPAYNAENFIEASVRCVLNQSFSDIELIVVNDGSTDRTAEILDSLCGNDSRLHVLTVPNGGPALARQLLDAGIDLSFGRRYNPASLALTPPDRRHFETDEEAR